jgi:DNA replication protein DnaC
MAPNATQQPESRCSSRTECPDCQGAGWVHVDGTSAVRSCRCRTERIQQDRIREVLEQWPAYADADLETVRPRNDAQAEAIEQLRNRPDGSYFIFGRYGSGKTRLLIAQYRQRALSGSGCILRSGKDLMRELQKAEMSDPHEKQQFLSEVMLATHEARPGGLHLFWDDLEAAPARSEFRQEAAFELLDRIWRKQLGLTVTSNVPLRDLEASGKLSSKAASRIFRLCSQIEL